MLLAKPSRLYRLTSVPHIALSINQLLIGAQLSKLSSHSKIVLLEAPQVAISSQKFNLDDIVIYFLHYIQGPPYAFMTF